MRPARERAGSAWFSLPRACAESSFNEAGPRGTGRKREAYRLVRIDGNRPPIVRTVRSRSARSPSARAASTARIKRRFSCSSSRFRSRNRSSSRTMPARAPRRYPPTGRRAPSAPAPGPRPARTTATVDLVMAAPGRLPVATRPDLARQAPAAAPAAPIVQSCASSGRLGRINGVKAIVQRFHGRAVAVRFRRIDATPQASLDHSAHRRELRRARRRTNPVVHFPRPAHGATLRRPPCLSSAPLYRVRVSDPVRHAVKPGRRGPRPPCSPERGTAACRYAPCRGPLARPAHGANPADDAPLAPPRAPGRQSAGRLPARCQGVQPESRATPEGPRRPAQPVSGRFQRHERRPCQNGSGPAS